MHTFAPEAEYSCHYFYSFISDSRVTKRVRLASRLLALFSLRTQRWSSFSKASEGYDMRKLTAIASDSARVQMSRFLERKIAEDQQELAYPARLLASFCHECSVKSSQTLLHEYASRLKALRGRGMRARARRVLIVARLPAFSVYAVPATVAAAIAGL